MQQQQNAAALYASNATVDTSDLMIRLRESIKQKEEFLKSPLPNVHHQQHQQTIHHQQQQQQQHFFPHTPPSGSPQLSMVSTSSTSVGGSGSSTCVVGGLSFVGSSNNAVARGQVRTLVKQPLSATSSSSSTRELLTANCDMHYAPNLGTSSATGGVSGGTYGSTAAAVMSRSQQQQQLQQQHQQQQQHRLTTGSSSSLSSSTNGSSSMLRDKYHHKDYEFMETLQETGVTNKV